MQLKAAAVSLLACVSLVLSQQNPTPKGQLEGVVLRNGSNEPIGDARVTLTRVNAATGAALSSGGLIGNAMSAIGPPPSLPANFGGTPAMLPPPPPPAIPAVYTDREGKFTIPNLDAGPYRLSVFAPDYVRQDYGQRVFPGQGTILNLAPGQTMKDLTFRLTLTGTVMGRLRDNSGRPAVAVSVQLLRAAYNGTGQKILQSAGSSPTNDRGEYRIYWVTPGRYYIAAGDSIPGVSLQRAVTGETYVYTYYPGLTDMATATSVDVTSGSEVALDFTVARQELFHIRGRVVDGATNRPPTSIATQLSYALVGGGGGVYGINTPYNANTGEFEIRDVSPGKFVLQISADGKVSRMPVTVANNIEALDMVLSGTFSLPGRVSVVGQLVPTGLDRLRFQLRPSNNAVAAVNATINPDGTMRFENVAAGEYRLFLNTAPGSTDYFVKEAKFDRSDVLNQPLVLSGSLSGDPSIEVTVSPSVGIVEGVVTDDKLKPMAGVQAVLVPSQNRDRAELFKAATTDQTGRFSIRAISPGDYKLFAWEALENNAYFDPDLIRQVEAQGKPLHVGESSTANVEIRAIPAK